MSELQFNAMLCLSYFMASTFSLILFHNRLPMQRGQTLHITLLHPAHPGGISRCIPMFATCSSIISTTNNHYNTYRNYQPSSIINLVNCVVLIGNHPFATTISIIIIITSSSTTTTTSIHYQLDPPWYILHLPLHNHP